MTRPAFSLPDGPGVASLLAEELARADEVLAGVDPILRQLLSHDDHALFSDRIVAQVAAQIEDLAQQLAVAVEAAVGHSDPGVAAAASAPLLAREFVANPAVVGHAHALALEALTAERLATRLSLDPVLSPLLEERIASPDPDSSAIATALVAAQARFVQAQRRGELPLAELPGGVLDAALVTMRGFCARDDPARDRAAAALQAAVRGNFDEAASRLGLLHRLIDGRDVASSGTLDLAHAGLALFVTALGIGAGFGRETAVLATSRGQLPRLALALVASGVSPAAAEQQCVALHPDVTLPAGFDTISAADAAALLAGAGRLAEG